GFRVEPGEIEAALRAHPNVRQAVVVARPDVRGDQRLVAYLVAAPDSTPSVDDLRAVVRGQLPDYMIPALFVTLDALPLSPNGKVDRKALPEPEKLRPELRADFVLPRNTVEEQLAAIWAEVLGVERVGAYDNFFELGGQSLLGVSMLSRVG